MLKILTREETKYLGLPVIIQRTTETSSLLSVITSNTLLMGFVPDNTLYLMVQLVGERSCEFLPRSCLLEPLKEIYIWTKIFYTLQYP